MDMLTVITRRVMTIARRQSLIISRDFNPGHYSHLLANYKLFLKNNLNPLLYIHPSFNTIGGSTDINICNHYSEILPLAHVDLAVFWFPSLKNILDIIRLRLHNSITIVYILPEPFQALPA